jgi:hypothetical protein
MKRFLVPTEQSNECKIPAKTPSDEGKNYQVGEHRANACLYFEVDQEYYNIGLAHPKLLLPYTE